MARISAVVLLALALVACGDDDGADGVDAGGGTDAGAIDAGPRPDSGGGSGDSCAEDEDPVATVGCNGWASGTPAANEPGGTCTPGGESDPGGSCTSATGFCAAEDGATEGTCLAVCTPAATYVSRGECPSGHRCFTLGEGEDAIGICFRDCDATHACPTGQECDDEGSCVDIETDGGVEMTDAGVEMSDAGVEADAGTDAGTTTE
ncbi:hypothetical protein [Sandaracinus amylolyticus]|uniref:hypothetical protein n=1 Tax=Sandaracinus amylolyticus TaxID=927083 RepID=UPI001F327E11|nr:hypothetical protein [Sandaracinus amylolyticus]UJR79351.1 Hypothetical protein I5071_13870 [Sandaracinus amylolyticus]